MILKNRRARNIMPVTIIVLLFAWQFPAGAAIPTSRILVIHSYHPSFDWTRNLHEGLVEVLDTWNGDFSLSVEYMDTKRIYSESHLNGLATLYQAKYREAPPDIVICSDNNAFDFLYERRRSIFGGDVPVIFCGVNRFKRENYSDYSFFVGVEEKPDLNQTIDIIDQFHQGYPPVVFISDRSVTGKAYSDEFIDWVETRADAGRFLLIDNGFPEGVLSQLRLRPPETILLYLTYAYDPAGHSYNPTALLHRIVESTHFPVYGNYTWMFGEGIVGGPLIDASDQGALAGEMAISVLEGAIDPAVFQVQSCPTRLVFDYRFMKKAKVFTGNLPLGAELYYQPDFFWRQFPVQTVLLAIIFVLLVGGLAVTGILLKQRGLLLETAGEINRRLKLDENRLETLVKLTHLDNQDDRRFITTVLEEAARITGSDYAVGVFRDNHSAIPTEFLVQTDPNSDTSIVSVTSDVADPAAPWLQPFHSRHTIQYNQITGPFCIGNQEISFRRGILVPGGNPKSDKGFSLVMGVFDKSVPYDEADERQLTLLTDGAWRILSRNRSEQEMRILNLSLESRVIERSEELRKAENQLVRSEKMATLGSLVAGLAHEVNTPLGLAVTGGSYIRDSAEEVENLYRDEMLDRETLEEFLLSVKDVSSSYMVNLRRAVDLLQTFKQVAVDRTGETPRRFNLAEYIQEILTTLRIPLKKSHVSVDVDCPADINLKHFPGDIGRVFTNLILNSLRHGFVDRKAGTISIVARENAGMLHLSHADDGNGIPESELGKIFDPFYTTARDSGGTGLGLHLVRSIICDKHGGTMDVESPKGKGVCFSFSFPTVSPALKEKVSIV